jgi:hypothetical protein
MGAIAVRPQHTPQGRAAARYRVLHVADRGQDAGRVREVGLSFAREADAARGTVHEAHAEPAFQLRQALGGGRRRQVEGTRGRGQAAVAGDQHEKFEFGGVVIH